MKIDGSRSCHPEIASENSNTETTKIRVKMSERKPHFFLGIACINPY